VAGAWVGFNDNRVTMGDSWGQGARSALPMVGEFFQHALKARVLDQQLRFNAPPSSGISGGSAAAEPLLEPENESLNGELPPGTEPQPESQTMDESSVMPPEDSQPAPDIRYMNIAPPPPEGPRHEPDRQAGPRPFPRPFDALPPQGRRSRAVEPPDSGMQELPEPPAPDDREPLAPN
jgi:penicillin-binding protein 1A